jgi:hypothetical protein
MILSIKLLREETGDSSVNPDNSLVTRRSKLRVRFRQGFKTALRETLMFKCLVYEFGTRTGDHSRQVLYRDLYPENLERTRCCGRRYLRHRADQIDFPSLFIFYHSLRL